MPADVRQAEASQDEEVDDAQANRARNREGRQGHAEARELKNRRHAQHAHRRRGQGDDSNAAHIVGSDLVRVDSERTQLIEPVSMALPAFYLIHANRRSR